MPNNRRSSNSVRCAYTKSRDRVLQQVKDNVAALADFTEAIRLAPGVSQLHLERAGTAIRLHNYDLAMEDLQMAEQLEPQQVCHHYTTNKMLHISHLQAESSYCRKSCRNSNLSQGRIARPTLPRHLRQCTVCIRRLWGMSFIVWLFVPISAASGLKFSACSKVLWGACVCSCGTRTRSLSAIVSLPCCKGPRHEHNPVISQAGGMDVVKLSPPSLPPPSLPLPSLPPSLPPSHEGLLCYKGPPAHHQRHDLNNC